MDKNLILTRCRKVYIHLRNNRIFQYGPNEGEYDVVNMYRIKKLADQVAGQVEEPRIWHRPDRPVIKNTVGEFYLVPATLIEN